MPDPNALIHRADRSGRLPAIFFALGATFFGLQIIVQASSFLAGFSQIMLVVFLAWLLAFLIGPAASAAHARLPISRPLAIALIYLVVSFAFAVLLFGAATVGAGEAADLIAHNDAIVASISSSLISLQSAIHLDPATFDLQAAFQSAEASVGPALVAEISNSFQTIAATTIAILGNMFVVVILSLYMVSDKEGLLATIERLVPPRFARELELVQRSVSSAFSGFLRTQILLVVIQVALTVAVSLAFGLPYMFLTCVVAGLFMFIPFFGPPLALLPPVLVAFAFVPEAFLPVFLILFIGQSVLVNYMQPKLMKRSVGIHPIMVIIALMVGAQVAGLFGAIFGIPIVAVIAVLTRYFIDLRIVAVSPVVELEEAVAAAKADDPSVPIEVAVASAAATAIAHRHHPDGSDVGSPDGSSRDSA